MSVLVRLQDPITGATETIAAPWQVISLMKTLAGHGAVCVARERGEAAPLSKRTIAMECEVPVFKSLLRCAHALVAEEHPDVTGLHPELAEAPPLSASNAAAIMVASDFLGFQQCLDAAVSFTATHFGDVAGHPANLAPLRGHVRQALARQLLREQTPVAVAQLTKAHAGTDLVRALSKALRGALASRPGRSAPLPSKQPGAVAGGERLARERAGAGLPGGGGSETKGSRGGAAAACAPVRPTSAASSPRSPAPGSAQGPDPMPVQAASAVREDAAGREDVPRLHLTALASPPQPRQTSPVARSASAGGGRSDALRGAALPLLPFRAIDALAADRVVAPVVVCDTARRQRPRRGGGGGGGGGGGATVRRRGGGGRSTADVPWWMTRRQGGGAAWRSGEGEEDGEHDLAQGWAVGLGRSGGEAVGDVVGSRGAFVAVQGDGGDDTVWRMRAVVGASLAAWSAVH